MKYAAAFALLATSCSVPQVQFYPDDATTDVVDASVPDTSMSSDGTMVFDAEAGVDDSPGYCTPDGPAAPAGTKCCAPGEGGLSALCSGPCNAQACAACGACAWPNICCSKGANGTCKPQCQ